jgi:beta-phosphoglucomutase-like phosphatase (HAD superfamily)
MPDVNAFVFDLDGTLVQTERLNAQFYAKATVELWLRDTTEEAGSAKRMAEMDVDAPWQAFVQVRLGYYHDLVQDPTVLRNNRWPHSLSLLDQAKENQCAVALATTSRRRQACHVLNVLGLDDIALLDRVALKATSPA